jgi:hypothetical protein
MRGRRDEGIEDYFGCKPMVLGAGVVGKRSLEFIPRPGKLPDQVRPVVDEGSVRAYRQSVAHAPLAAAPLSIAGNRREEVVRWIVELPNQVVQRKEVRPEGIVKLRRPLADLANEHQYTNLSGIPISSGYYQPCRLALSPILPELPRC